MANIKIMLVDDHQIVRDGIKSLLESLDNVQIIGEASNGNELLAYLETIKPDIVITDISMPDMSGIELTKIINGNEKYKDIKVLSRHVSLAITVCTSKLTFWLFKCHAR